MGIEDESSARGYESQAVTDDAPSKFTTDVLRLRELGLA